MRLLSLPVALALTIAPGCARPDSGERSKARGAGPSAHAASETPEPAPAPASAPPAPEAEPESEPSSELPVVTAEALIASVRSSGKKGALINAWASWCGPCRREIPMLQNLAPNLRSAGIEVLLVSVDEPADAHKAAAFLRDNHITLKSYLAERPLGRFKQGMNPRWPGMLPASFLYDASGRLRYYWGGEAFEQEIVPILDAFGAGRSIEGESAPLVVPETPTP